MGRSQVCLHYSTVQATVTLGWAQINQQLELPQTPFHRWAPIKLTIDSSNASSSECLFSEGQTQERRRFYNGSVKQQRAPRFIGDGRRYVTVVVQAFTRTSDLTAVQVTLEPTSIEVSDY